MKLLLLTLLCAALGWAAESSKTKNVRSIAVLDLDGTGLDAGEVKTLSDALRNNIIEFNTYAVLERGKMDIILKEQGFQQTGACTNDACAVEMGQLLGVDAMVVGSVGRVGKTFSITVRMLDLTTGQILKSASSYYKGEIDGLLTETIVSVASKISSVDTKKTTQTVLADEKPTPATPSEPAKPEVKKSRTLLYVGISALLVAGGVGTYLVLQNSEAVEEHAKRPPIPNPPSGLFLSERGGE